MGSARFGFVGWNPFQLLQSLDVARELAGSVIVLEKRADQLEPFSEQLLRASDVPILMWERERMAELDGVFDVLVCQTVFTHIERIRRSKIAMLQYGLAKEPHNYGAWRSLADLCLVYGPYAAEKMAHFCPVAAVGNPRLDSWQTRALAERARAHYGHLLDPACKTVLYVPTWGELSTQELYLEHVERLAEHHNVLVKLHHNTDLLEHHRVRALPHERVHRLGANDDLLELLHFADVVLSDYSGAIFDALYCKKPVILLQQLSTQRFGAKLDAHSLEYAAQSRIGPVVESANELAPVVERILGGELSFAAANEQLVRELYVPGPGSSTRAAEALSRLGRGEVPSPSQMQSYVRQEMRRLRLEATRREGSSELDTRRPKLRRLRNLERRILEDWLREGEDARVVRYVAIRSLTRPKLYLYRAGIRAAINLRDRRKVEQFAQAARAHFPGSSVGDVRGSLLLLEHARTTASASDPTESSGAGRVNEAQRAEGRNQLHRPVWMRAGRYAAQAVRRLPPVALAQVRRARALRQQGQADAARHMLEALPSPSHVERDLLLAELACDAGDRAGALDVLTLAQRHHTGDSRLLLRMAELLRDAGHPDRALVYAQLADGRVGERSATTKAPTGQNEHELSATRTRGNRADS